MLCEGIADLQPYVEFAEWKMTFTHVDAYPRAEAAPQALCPAVLWVLQHKKGIEGLESVQRAVEGAEGSGAQPCWGAAEGAQGV